jgi:hypothetical protein
MKMFADLPTPSPTELNTFLSCVLVVIGLILAGIKLTEKLKGKKPKPPNEQLSESHAVLTQRVGKLEATVEKNREAAEAQARVRSAGLYSKMEEVRKQTSDHTESVRKELSEKIDAMPDRVVALLRNTGALER